MIRFFLLGVAAACVSSAPAAAQSFPYHYMMDDSEVVPASGGRLTDNGPGAVYRFTGDDDWLGRRWRVAIMHSGGFVVDMRTPDDPNCSQTTRALSRTPGWQRSRDANGNGVWINEEQNRSLWMDFFSPPACSLQIARLRRMPMPQEQ